MNLLIRTCILSSCLLSGAALAESFYVDLPRGEATKSTLNAQARLTAEQHMVRLSGLSRLSVYQRTDRSSAAYEQAKARYEQLIASAQFAQLVAALERNPGLEVIGR